MLEVMGILVNVPKKPKNPGDSIGVKAAKRVLLYLKATANRGLMLKRSGYSDFSLQIVCDSDWASQKIDRKSICLVE